MSALKSSSGARSDLRGGGGGGGDVFR